jgi:GGDEF domain-containing protein
VESTETDALIRISQSRFRNFAEAAESILGSLAEVVPGVLLLGQVDPDERSCRVIGLHGVGVEGIHRGAVLPLASTSEVDRAFLDSLGVEACVGTPLEMSDGRVVATLSALAVHPDAYSWDHVAMLGIAARLLSHEWESVERRAEIRRLRGRLPESDNIDPETHLLSRKGFLDLLDHDWGLADRAVAESVVVAFRVGGGPERGGEGGARGRLALKIAAEVLGSSVRSTDRAGRAGEATLAVSLVGCGTEQAPAFVERYLAALGRVTGSGGPDVELSHGIQSLRGPSSAEEALTLAIVAAGASANGAVPGEPTFEEVPE